MITPDSFFSHCNTERDDQLHALHLAQINNESYGMEVRLDITPPTGNERVTMTDPLTGRATYNPFSDYITPDINYAQYGGCQKCREFSACFGGRPYEGHTIKTEEDFEIIKEKFVSHVNEKHRDIINKKRDTPHVNKKFEKIIPPLFILESTPRGVNFDENMFYQEYNCNFSINEQPSPATGQPIRRTPAERRGFRSRISNRHHD